jgi:hypothetical protein
MRQEAIQREEELAEQYGCTNHDEAGNFEIVTCWWYDETDPVYRPSWKYEEGSHIVVVDDIRSGKMLGNSELFEPGRLVQINNDKDARPPRTYYYLLIKRSAERHTRKELRNALAAVDVKLDYSSQYLRPRVIDAILRIWADIDYDEV